MFSYYFYSVLRKRKSPKKLASHILLKDRTHNGDKYDKIIVRWEQMQSAPFSWGGTVEDLIVWGLSCNGFVL